MYLPKKVFPFLVHFVFRQWGKFTFIVAASLFWGVSSALFPFFLKKIIDAFATHSDFYLGWHAARNFVFLLLGFIVVAEIFLRLQGFVIIHFITQLRADIRTALFEYVQTHSASYFATHFSGAIAGKISDVPMSAEQIMRSIFFEIVVASTGMIVVLATVFWNHSLIAALLLLWFLIHLGITFHAIKKSNHPREEHANAVTTLSGKIVDIITNIQSVKFFAREKYERDYLRHFQQDEIIKSIRAEGIWQQKCLLFSLNVLCMFFGLLTLLIMGWKTHSVTLGDFTQVMMQASFLAGWMWFVSFQMSFLATKIATINAALILIQQPHDIVDAPNAAALKVIKGEICFDHVDFSYDQQSVFQDLHVTIHTGEKVGVVGLSGAGKTTFMNLILRLYELNGGKILIDGKSIATVTQESLHENIAVIPQEPLLFHRALMENIRYGRLKATDEEVIKASEQAHCHEFIEQLSAKYETLVGERGVKLSGGQRQRIAIARALLKNAPILILDEATSSLDSMTEKKIQEALHTLMQERTTIVIAHRLSTLMAMDRILVFHEGVIVEDGTIQELLQKGNHFAALWKMQRENSSIEN